MIKQDEYTGEVQDSYGNWYNSYDEYLDAMASLSDRQYDEMKDEELFKEKH